MAAMVSFAQTGYSWWHSRTVLKNEHMHLLSVNLHMHSAKSRDWHTLYCHKQDTSGQQVKTEMKLVFINSLTCY
jgi:hypothetical protein